MRGFGTCYRQKASRFWWAQYWKDGKRFRESTGTTRLREAQAFLLRKLSEIEDAQDGTHHAAILVSHLYDNLERDYLIQKRKSIRNIRTSWENHLKVTFAARIAEQVDADDIANYIAVRQLAGAKNATVNRELAALKRMFKLAKISGKLKIEMPYIPHLAENNVRQGFVKDAQYEALAAATATAGLWLRAMFEVGYTFGWRKGELLGLKVEQVDLLERTITLNPAEIKNKTGRIVAMTAKVFELLSRCCHGKGVGQYVFTREVQADGRRPKVRAGNIRDGKIVDFRDSWASACEAAGCPGLLFHDLRRSGVRNMRRHRVSQVVAMRISGHITDSVFRRYNIVDEDDLQDARDKMDQGARERQQRELFTQADMFERKQPASTPAKSHRTAIVGNLTN